MGLLCFLLRFSLFFCGGIVVSFLCCCTLCFSDTECNQIFHSFRPRQTPTSSLPGGLLKWKKRLVNDVRLLLPIKEVMKIVELTSLLPNMLLLLPPRPRLRRDKGLALLSFVLLLVLFPPLLTSPTVSLPESRFRSSPTT